MPAASAANSRCTVSYRRCQPTRGGGGTTVVQQTAAVQARTHTYRQRGVSRWPPSAPWRRYQSLLRRERERALQPEGRSAAGLQSYPSLSLSLAHARVCARAVKWRTRSDRLARHAERPSVVFLASEACRDAYRPPGAIGGIGGGVEGYPRGLALTKRVETLGGTETRGATWCWRRRLKEDAERCLSSAGRLLACLLAWLRRLEHWASPIERWEQQHSQNLVRENLFYACLWLSQWSDIFVIILNINSRYLFRKIHSILCIPTWVLFWCESFWSCIMFMMRDFLFLSDIHRDGFWFCIVFILLPTCNLFIMTGSGSILCLLLKIVIPCYFLWEKFVSIFCFFVILLCLYYSHRDSCFVSVLYSFWGVFFPSILCNSLMLVCIMSILRSSLCLLSAIFRNWMFHDGLVCICPHGLFRATAIRLYDQINQLIQQNSPFRTIVCTHAGTRARAQTHTWKGWNSSWCRKRMSKSCVIIVPTLM